MRSSSNPSLAFLLAFLLACCICFLLLTGSLIAANPEDALQRLNQIRRSVHLNPLQLHPALNKAAQNHAEYLKLSPEGFHSEDKSKPYFTGKTPTDRGLYAGYQVAKVAENLSLDHLSLTASLEGLMGAIYHRLLFLSFEHDQLGFGTRESKNGGVYVYNLGIQSLETLCKEGTGKYYRQFYELCRGGKRLDYQQYHQAIEALPKRNPLVILWPAEGSEDTPPAFYHEIPDPLPDLALSGYPISIQLNPVLLSEPELVSFKLFDGASGEEITNVRLLSKETDPNHLLTEFQFALFPLERLQWGHDYFVEAELKTKEKTFELRWQYQTKSSRSILVPVEGKGEVFYLKSGESYSFYFPPLATQAYVQKFDMESGHQLKVVHQWEDRNTLNLTFTAKSCERVRVFFEPYYSFQVEFREREALGKKQIATQPVWCIQDGWEKLPVLDLSRGNVVLPVVEGNSYYLYVAEGLKKLHMKYSSKADISLAQVGPQLFKLQLKKGVGKVQLWDQSVQIAVLSVKSK